MRIPKCKKCNKMMTFINTRIDKDKNRVAIYKCFNKNCINIEITEIPLKK